jgi:hypothetical protein
MVKGGGGIAGFQKLHPPEDPIRQGQLMGDDPGTEI